MPGSGDVTRLRRPNTQDKVRRGLPWGEWRRIPLRRAGDLPPEHSVEGLLGATTPKNATVRFDILVQRGPLLYPPPSIPTP
eukprot:COSAG04_NODE_23258_length_341_cov_0.859504_1_plen_81_part_00